MSGTVSGTVAVQRQRLVQCLPAVPSGTVNGTAVQGQWDL
jgi:hypothetical protein